MIELRDVSKSFTAGNARKVILEHASFRIMAGQKIGILASEGSGKSTLANLLCGTEAPDSGKMLKHGRISFPIGQMPGLDPKLSASENTRNLARLYRLDTDHAEAFCRYLTGAGPDFDLPLDAARSGLRKRLALALLLALPFDVYLMDNGPPQFGDRAFMQRALPVLQHRLALGTLILLSSNPSILQRYCQCIAVLTNGQLLACSSLDQARGIIAHAA